MQAFDAIVVVDWSAAATPGPARPTANRIWIGAVDGEGTVLVPARYLRTRALAIAMLGELLDSLRGRVLLGVDFALGYPRSVSGEALLPGGRELCRFWADRLSDDADDRNTRFHAAAGVGEEIAARLGLDAGPFWGCPSGDASAGVTPTRPPCLGVAVREYRATELAARAAGWPVQSPWKLAYAGSVGSQAITGGAALSRLLDTRGVGERMVFWPFEDGAASDDAIVVAEAYPTLAEHAHPSVGYTPHRRHDVRDADQVEGLASLVARAMASGADPLTPAAGTDEAEGWILGVGAPWVAAPERRKRA